VGLRTPHRIKISLLRNVTKGSGLGRILLDKRLELKKMSTRFRTGNVRSAYTAGSLVRVAKEMPKYKLDLVGVQEVRRNTVSVQKRIISAVKRVEFVSDRM
jgi:hypothetical protein